MGSVKDLVIGCSPAGRLYTPPTDTEFGKGVWQVSGRFSVGDLKEVIPDTTIKDKAEALTMSTAAFFEWLTEHHPEIPTCYIGVLGEDSEVTSVRDLIDRGQKTNMLVMKLAHVPETYCHGDLKAYREAISSGKLQCGVADVESIFRHGFPLGSSTFEKIFNEVGKGEEYETLATYPETIAALDEIRVMVAKRGLREFPGLEKLLAKSDLTGIPNPGFVLKHIVYNSTSKFEVAGDRELTPEEERKFSGLSEEGYALWTQHMFPELARAQIQFCDERGILNIDGKAECVTYRRKPVVTDFACTVDENRLMIIVEFNGERWAIPSNKEIQRAIFRREGVYAAIAEAKRSASKKGSVKEWRNYVPQILRDRGINLRGVAEHSCDLMGYAIGEVANRILGEKVFDAPLLYSWVPDFLPYASKVEYQK
ncbi:MAG: hypothetical protein AABX71_01115 [Nanoarchaeota archaeon]